MSAEAAVAGAGWRNPAAALRGAQVFRFTLGLVLASGIAFAFAWPLAFLMPVIAAKLLTAPRAMSVRVAVGALALLGVSLLFATQVMLPTLDYPPIHVALTGLLLYRLMLWKISGGPAVVVVLLIIGILLVPLVGTVDPELAGAVAVGLYLDAVLAVAIVFMVSALIPDPADAPPHLKPKPEPLAESRRERSTLAIRSVVVLLPLAASLQLFSLTDATVSLMMAILLTLEPRYGKHLKTGMGLLAANLAGGLVAVAMYQAMIFVPSYAFLLLVTSLAGLVIGGQIFSGSKVGKLLGAGITTAYIVLGPSLTGTSEAGASMLLRLAFVVVGVAYVVFAFGLMERLHLLKRGRVA